MIERFIKRPVLATGISILIVLVGLIALLNLPVEQYPNMAPPTVVVSTSYTGANAQTVQKSVIAPLEAAINGVEGMIYMTSTAANGGRVTITVFFRPGTNADIAAVNVQNRVNGAMGILPSEVVRAGVTTSKQENSMLMQYVIYSDNEQEYDRAFMSNYLKINVEPALLRIPGVGDVNALGTDYSMRIWLKPDVMAQHNLEPSDIVNVLGEQNIEAATGQLGENSNNTFQYTLKYTGRLITPEQFGEMVIRALPNGEILKLKDVAKIEMGSVNYMFSGITNNKPSIFCMVYQMPGSNATEVIGNIETLLNQVNKDLPKGLHLLVVQNSNDFLSASIKHVVRTLLEAIILVILVVFVFLQNVRSMLIPTISILVSLIGTFAFLAIAGFTINLLTLFALILVIGTVVDDSIVVVEAIQAKFDGGYTSPYLAARDGMKGITSAIITSSLIFMVVFIPVSFTGGVSGTFYKQFGITMAIAVGISAINALTLCPALCVMIMRPVSENNGALGKFRKAYNSAYSTILNKYRTGVFYFIKRKWLTAGLIVIAFGLLATLMYTTKTGFIPNEDQGTIRISVTLPPGSSLYSTNKVLLKLDSVLSGIDEIESRSLISGYNFMTGQGPSGGNGLIKLKPWSERDRNAEEILKDISQRVSTLKEAKIAAFTPPMISGFGSTNGVELYILDRSGHSIDEFYTTSQNFIKKLNERTEIANAFTTFSPNYPQYEVSVDAAKAKRAGVSPNDVLSVIQGYVGGIYASNFNRFNKSYQVILQASPEYRLDEHSFNNMYVRINGSMAPVSQYASLKKVYSSENLQRFNLFSSISINAQAADGYSSGDAIKAIEEVAKSLPLGYGYDFGGMSRTERESSNTIGIILALSIVFVYIILSMLYESYFIPFAVLLAVPFGLAGSFIFAKVFGLDNNIYLQMGLVMLIGLITKTGILLTEYASERRKEGMSLVRAAFSASKERLRPILMTGLTMIIGLMPMMLSSGVGANGNRVLGTGVVGGLLIGLIALLFVVPVLFIVFQWLQEKFVKPHIYLENDENESK
jgi:HAE1 family hydrophobic/amphiphilic exporter-1